MIAAICARVSTADQNCALQLADLREWCTRHRWTVFSEYVDHGVSGSKASRPELDRLLKDARAHMFDVVLVTKMDRFGRSVQHLSKNLADFDRWGIRFIATSQGIDTDKANPTNRLLMNILASVAEFERELIVERTRAGLHAAMARGVRVGGPVKVFDRSVADRLYEEGKSLRAIAGELGISFSTLRGDFKRRGKLEEAGPVPIVVDEAG